MLVSYLTRLSSTWVKGLGREKVPVLEEVRLPLQISPMDLDIYGHVNNGRYLTLMDFGRFAHTQRTGMLKVMLQRRWIPVLGSATVSYFRELKAFDRIELVTRLACWDEKWFFFEHRFERKGTVCALGAVKGVCKHRGRTVPPSELSAAVGYEGPSPEFPEFISRWNDAQPRRAAS
ncbi:MAG: thioesterase family protein [Myxococcaceae bacterium]